MAAQALANPKATAPSSSKVRPDRFGLIPLDKLNIDRLIRHRHSDWWRNQNHWRFLLDSYEAGETYRNSCYGYTRDGLPVRNLRRHRREYPDPQRYPDSGYATQGFPGEMLNGGAAAYAGAGMGPGGPFPGQLGADPNATADDDPYEMRRAATPIPEFVAEAVELHLSKLFGQEIGRDTGGTDEVPATADSPAIPATPGIDELEGWWDDVDGRGTTIDDWMRQTIAPLLAVLGCLDVCFDHPRAPHGETVETKADELRLGLNKCVASYILPENMVWWRLDAAGRYRECLVREFVDPCDRVDRDQDGNAIDPNADDENAREWRKNYVRWRLWRPDVSVLYNNDGEELERTPHAFGRVPIVRLVDQPKPKTPHIGKSRYEAVADYQKAYYNLNSEVIANNTLQASPLLCVPDRYLKADGEMSIGRDWALPIWMNSDGTSHIAPTYISPSSDPSDSLRQSQNDFLTMKDRRACLARPLAVRASTGGGNNNGPSVDPQAAAAKQIDAIEGYTLLQSLAQTFAKAERIMAEYALLVCRDGKIAGDRSGDPKAVKAVLDRITVTYPSKFDLYAVGDMLQNWTALQKCLMAAGNLPMFEREMLRSIVRQALPGLDDDGYGAFDGEIQVFVDAVAKIKEERREIGDPGFRSDDDALAGYGSDEHAAEGDPTGESNTTAVTGGYVTT